MKRRSLKKEMMDGPLDNPEILYQNLGEIRFINKLTALYSLQFNEIRRLIPRSLERVEIVDIGCGGGDFLHYLHNQRKHLPKNTILSGLDNEPEALKYAHQKFPQLKHTVNWQCQDYKSWLEDDQKTDIICCNLFCHHLNDDDIANLLEKASKKARLGLIINDLHRHPIAYYSIKLLTRLFSSSAYTKNDAPLSVLRSFTRKDWKKFIDSTENKGDAYVWEVKWLPTFRYLVSGRNTSI